MPKNSSKKYLPFIILGIILVAAFGIYIIRSKPKTKSLTTPVIYAPFNAYSPLQTPSINNPNPVINFTPIKASGDLPPYIAGGRATTGDLKPYIIGGNKPSGGIPNTIIRTIY